MKNYIHAVMQKDFSIQILKTLFCEKDIMQSLAELYTTYKDKSAEKLNELINSELDKKGKPKQKQSGSGAKNTTQPSPTQVFCK